MDTASLKALYQSAADIINNMIPEEWNSVYLYSEMDEDGGEVLFYYFKSTVAPPIYSMEIPNIFNLDKMEYRQINYQLYRCFRNIRNEFIANHQEPWTVLTFVLSNKGDYKTEYSYEELEQSDSDERLIIWEYKKLGIKPKNNSDLAFLESYLKSEC